MTPSTTMRAANVGDMRPNITIPTPTRDSFDGLKSHADIVAAHEQWRDAQPTVTRCAHCDWTYTGPAGDARQRFAKHVTDDHPGVKPARRRRQTVREQAMVLVVQRAEDAAKSGRREETPMDTDGRVERADRALEQAHQPGCKIDGCDEPAAATRGPYALLCVGHRAEAVERRGNVKPARRSRKKADAPPARANGQQPDRLARLAVDVADAINDLNRLNGERDAARARVLAAIADLNTQVAEATGP